MDEPGVGRRGAASDGEEPGPADAGGRGSSAREFPEGEPAGRDTTEDPTVEVSHLVNEAAPASGGAPADAGDAEGIGMLRARLSAKDRHVRELYDEVAALRAEADEAAARTRAVEGRLGDLEEERDRLVERVRLLEEEERRRRRRREAVDRRVGRLEREIERREDEIERLKRLLERREGEMDLYGREAEDIVSRKDAALSDALRRVEGLERDLEEREAEVADLRGTVGELRAALDLEYELRRRMAEPENRLRSGLDLFNGSEHARSVASVSKSLGTPEVRVDLGEGEEPPVVLKFFWRGDAPLRQTFHSNPGLGVEEPRVYLAASEEGRDLDGARRRDLPNARADADGRVSLGL